MMLDQYCKDRAPLCQTVVLALIVMFTAVHASAQPTWTAILTSSAGGDWFDYYDTSPYKTESTGGTVALQSTYGMPAANAGCDPSNGCLAYCTFPNSDPWFFSSGCKTDSGGTPSDNDCTGTHQIPGPSTFSRTHAAQSGVKGIQFDGTFNGSASGNPGDYLIETVFAHQQQCYAGHQEYGFARTLPGGLGANPPFYFYWSDYTNCDGAICYDNDNHPQIGTAQNSRVGLIDLGTPNTSQTNRYEAYIFRDSGTNTLKFQVNIYEPYTASTPTHSYAVDPNDHTLTSPDIAYPSSSTYDIGAMNGASLWVSVSTVKNPNSTLQSTSTPDPALDAVALRIGQ